jgi:hypothetical protein
MDFYNQTKQRFETTLITKKQELQSFRERLLDVKEWLLISKDLSPMIEQLLHNHNEIAVYDIQKTLDDLNTSWQRYKMLQLKISLCEDEIKDLNSGIDELVNVFLKDD